MSYREHVTDTDSGLCWCDPEFFLPCDECEDGAGCWKCQKGLIRITREEAQRPDTPPCVIVHRP